MSVSSTFHNDYAAGRFAARESTDPCPANASAETKLGYIAERAKTTPKAHDVEALLAGIDPPRRGQVGAGFHAAMMRKDLIGDSARTCAGANEKALLQVLRHAAGIASDV